jgi:hypothetical protein
VTIERALDLAIEKPLRPYFSYAPRMVFTRAVSAAARSAAFPWRHFSSYRHARYADETTLSVIDTAAATRRKRENIVVSMTTLPDRIDLIKPTIYSLLNQTTRAREIAINIPATTLSGKTYPSPLPAWLTSLKAVRIYRYEGEDYGPSSKLIPTLLREKAAETTRIVVVDDDQIYAQRFIETLVARFEEESGRAAVANLAASWRSERFVRHRSQRVIQFVNSKQQRRKDVLFGFGGYVVSPQLFFRKGSRGVFDYSGVPEYAKKIDDEWVSFWLKAGGVEIVTAGGRISDRWAVPVLLISDLGMAASLDEQNERSRALKKYFDETVFAPR